MFKKFKSTKTLCEAFKKKAIKFSKDNDDLKQFVISIADIDKFFFYDSSKLQSTYIKKSVKDELVKMGIRFEKIKGREQAYVKIES